MYCVLFINYRKHSLHQLTEADKNNQIEHGVDECEDIDDDVKNVNKEK